MAKENIIITATKSGKTIQKSLTDVNPEATNAQLATFGTMLNALTTNTYQKTDRITKVNCDTEPGGGAKQTPTLTLSRSSRTLGDAVSDIGADGTCNLANVTTNSDGHLYARNPTIGALANQFAPYIALKEGKNTFRVTNMSNATSISTTQTLIVGVTETDTYTGKEVEFTITA